MPYDAENYPHRNYNTPSGRYETKGVLRGLEKLEIKTHPDGGAPTADHKDLAAFSALEVAGDLVEYVAGWAIDHQVGIALEDLEFVPIAPRGGDDDPEYLAARHAVDDHRHEQRGGKASRALLQQHPDPRMARRLLINLLRANPGGFPRWLVDMTVDALEGLEYGSVDPILARSNDGKKRGLRELKMQKRALGFVYYYETLSNKKKAQAKVGAVIGISDETFKTWKKNIKAAFGVLEIQRERAWAIAAASRPGSAGGCDPVYSQQAMKSWAAEYNKLLRARGSAG